MTEKIPHRGNRFFTQMLEDDIYYIDKTDVIP